MMKKVAKPTVFTLMCRKKPTVFTLMCRKKVEYYTFVFSHADLAFVKSNSYIKRLVINIFVDSTLYICYVESTNRTLINEMVEYIYLSMHVLYIQCTE